MEKQKNRKKLNSSHKQRSSWTSSLLALSLVPTVIGFLLIGAWAFDLNIFGNPQSQSFVGILLILIGFTLSNAFQKKYSLAFGWALLTIADLIILLWVVFWAQVLALVIGLVGTGILFSAFYQHWKEERFANKKQSKPKDKKE